MKNMCSIPGCPRPINTRGWCKPHYDAWYRKGDPAAYLGRGRTLWEKITHIGWTRNALTGCNEWNGHRNALGYGQYRHGKGGLLRVHRIVYETLVGPLTSADQVLHKCDNPACSEPSHLRKGDVFDNMRDMRAKRRGYKDTWTHCPNGHPYPADRPPASTSNRCRECARDRNRRYMRRKQVA